MAFSCSHKACKYSSVTRRALANHVKEQHGVPQPHRKSRLRFHPKLTARPCDSNGNFLPDGAPVPPRNDNNKSWEPFQSRPQFSFAEWVFERTQTSKANVRDLLELWAAHEILENGHDENNPIFKSYDDLIAHIDAIQHGEAPYYSVEMHYEGDVDHTSPSWKREPSVLFTRDAKLVADMQLGNPEFDGRINYRPYIQRDEKGERMISNLMSANFAWRQADKIAEDPNTHGATEVVIVSGADKTTVSVATGDTEFHPVYQSLGNFTNEARRSHGDAVMPIAFLAIPKAARAEDDTVEFRLFKKQLYHASIAHILAPLRDGMTTPQVVRCADGHYRRVIYELGPFIADYPEQVVLSGIVSGWCPKCRARPEDMDTGGPARSRAFDDAAKGHFSATRCWDLFGIVEQVTPYTSYFPRGDIHELLTPDLLHQVIKGTFKDHLVCWIEAYIRMDKTEKEADRIMDDIDRKLASVLSFPGLRRFPEGRNFKQWTGADSRALMKIFAPAIVGHVPNQMVMAVVAFLDFCYLARRDVHTSLTLRKMDEALARFHAHREVFRRLGVREEGFTLPRQHALVHYVPNIRLFGSPNGLCSSITESKHIDAVKRPWRRSSRYNALTQILYTNVRLSKLRAARAVFALEGMFRDDERTAALRAVGLLPPRQDDMEDIAGQDDVDADVDEVDAYHAGHREIDAADVNIAEDTPSVALAKKPLYSRSAQRVARKLKQPDLPSMIRMFLQDQLYPDPDLAAADIGVDACPMFTGNVQVYPSAQAYYYAPSDKSGTHSMHVETIRSVKSWYGSSERRDTVLVQNGDEADAMGGMLVARVLAFLAFTHNDIRYPCALVQWYRPVGDEPDPVTGMWIVKPIADAQGRRDTDLIHLDCVIRSCLLQGVTNSTFLPRTFHFSRTHVGFKAFYVTKFADYHTHETYAE
ncbi:hypothetical protein PENSPDRAFT_595273 [Peniophora sp. CONT]|nr:hypothetical protein PENSPDRAFT_595273 [Peniophora sp. CONT]